MKWANENKVEWHYINPGKPRHNGYILRLGEQSPELFADLFSLSTVSISSVLS
jgi:hypothetical protein